MSDLSYTTGIQHDIHGNPMAMFSTSKGVWRIPVEVATHIALADEARHDRIRELEAFVRRIASIDYRGNEPWYIEEARLLAEEDDRE